MSSPRVSTNRTAIAVAILFWVPFVSNLRNVMDMQRTARILLRPWLSMDERATLRIGLRLPSPDPSIAEFLLLVPGERTDREVARVRPSGVVDVTWAGESGAPVTWRAVALDRAGCIVYAGTTMWSPQPTSQTNKLDMPLRHLDMPLCALAQPPEAVKLVAVRELL